MAGRRVKETADMAAAARSIQALGPGWVLVTGGRIGNDAVDVLFDGHETFELRAPWIQSDNTHGSGDTLSAAVTAFLAKGAGMAEAIQPGTSIHFSRHSWSCQLATRPRTWAGESLGVGEW